MQLELVAEGLQFPEGPVAMADGSVILVEIRRGTLSRVKPGGAVEVVAELGGGPNGAAIGPDGAAYVCNNGGFEWHVRPDGGVTPHGIPANYAGGSIQRVDLATGKFTTVYTEGGGRKLRGPNDLVFDKSGGFWFTDLGKADDERMDIGHLYYARPDGSEIIKARSGITTPNGCGLSPDGKVIYVAETRTSRVWAFDIEGPGKIRQPQDRFQPHKVMGPLPGYQFLDSLAVEADGRVCVATIINGGVTIFNPADGSTDHVSVPDTLTTNICFGGPDMRDAWITASSTGKLYKGRWPRPGLKLNFNA
ncbi:SMP-30/gluconolactonase/LRE family protein [Chelatococcus reniformis]|uniref:Gluconolactonase n=1 Tax=Chelatococcus reniformis TaxID=1494448 RepID=A0A916X7Y9_9HYPH|nr:SMP-30/gluconolactonase/LRE family protein [Chelatococcus reniformis]GGC45213.1 gluconolactonase [Chelatococcus reniformis]